MHRPPVLPPEPTLIQQYDIPDKGILRGNLDLGAPQPAAPLNFDELYAKQQAAVNDPALHREVYQTLRGRPQQELAQYEAFARGKRAETAPAAEEREAETTQQIGASVLSISQRLNAAPAASESGEVTQNLPLKQDMALFKREAPQDTPEVDPKSEPLFAGGWGSILSPENSDGGYGVTQYNPREEDGHFRRREYKAEGLEEDERPPTRVLELLRDRGFAWTGEVPETIPGYVGLKYQETPFYQEKRVQIGSESQREGEVAGTLVRVDGFSVLALGHVDLEGLNRGRLSFAAKGNLSARELVRRARAIFPETFEKIDKNIVLAEEPREIIDLT